MSGPPSNISPESLLGRLMAMPRATRMVTHPRKNADGVSVGEIAMHALHESEFMSARAAAEQFASNLLDKGSTSAPRDSRGYQEIYANELFVELLVRACREPSDPKVPSFPTTQHLRAWCSPDEISVLFEAYQLWQTEAGPIVSAMSEADMEKWIDVLAEGASRVPLAVLSSAAKNDLLLRMASLLRSSRTDTYSRGSPVDEPSSAYEPAPPSATEST